MFSTRVLRRRWVLAVIFSGSFLYFICTFFQKSSSSKINAYEVERTLMRQPFQWQPKIPDVEVNTTTILRCRNSVQGREFIVDERGYVCERDAVTVGNCCDLRRQTTSRYNCTSCRSSGCCNIYENCVSCCLHPEKKPILEKILSQATESLDKLFVSVSDHFELCLAKCRTSSQSVQHENSYRDPRSKHCYGEDPPDLQVVVSR